MDSVQVISSIIGVSVSLLIFYLIRRDHLLTRDGLRWLLVAVGILLVGFFPQLFDAVGKNLGVSYPPIVVVLIALAIVVIKLLVSDIQRARMKVDIERLVQKVGMLEADLERKSRTWDNKSGE